MNLWLISTRGSLGCQRITRRGVTDELFPPTGADGQAEPIPYKDNRHYGYGQLIEYNGSIYMCMADHYAALGWTPENAHANWQNNRNAHFPYAKQGCIRR